MSDGLVSKVKINLTYEEAANHAAKTLKRVGNQYDSGNRMYKEQYTCFVDGREMRVDIKYSERESDLCGEILWAATKKRLKEVFSFKEVTTRIISTKQGFIEEARAKKEKLMRIRRLRCGITDG